MTLKDILNTQDRFASSSGIALTKVSEGMAQAEMTVEERHLNGGRVCQGGAIFTLADFAIAAVMNSHDQLTFGIQNSITFLQSAQKGDKLTATATEKFNHPKIPYCDAEVRNQDGKLIAIATGQGYRKKDAISFDALQ